MYQNSSHIKILVRAKNVHCSCASVPAGDCTFAPFPRTGTFIARVLLSRLATARSPPSPEPEVDAHNIALPFENFIGCAYNCNYYNLRRTWVKLMLGDTEDTGWTLFGCSGGLGTNSESSAKGFSMFSSVCDTLRPPITKAMFRLYIIQLSSTVHFSRAAIHSNCAAVCAQAHSCGLLTLASESLRRSGKVAI
jgi:hypothetical protein